MSVKNKQNWRVKITGLPRHVSAPNLSNELNIARRKIIIPKCQYDPCYWHAWICDFENEDQAKTFAAQWDQRQIYGNYKIRSTASKTPNRYTKQTENVIEKPSSNQFRCTTLIQDQDTDDSKHEQEAIDEDSESLGSGIFPMTNESNQISNTCIEKTLTSLSLSKVTYRLRESSSSLKISKQSGNRLYYHESKCYKPNCSLRHPPSLRACDDEIQRDDYECATNHSSSRSSLCSEDSTSFNCDYRLLDPNKLLLQCIDGVYCCTFECRALHPMNRRIPCQYGKQCYNTTCLCLHPFDRQLCVRGVECIEFECKCVHPPGRLVNCTDGLNCDNVNCSRLHPLEWNPNNEVIITQVQQATKSYNRQAEHKLKSLNERMKERSEAQLPILASRVDFCERLTAEKLLVITAETGSGKSTQLPQYAAEHFRDGLIVCTQPRVVAAISLARRVAEEYDGSSEGYSVGYQVGSRSGNNMCTQGTRIMFMTDAALIRESQLDPTLSKVRVLIIDEAHERSLNTDIVLGIAKLVFNKRPNDFFVVISSATINPTGFLQFFDRPLNRPLTVPGHLYEVTEEYLPPPSDCNEQKLIERHIVPTVLRLFPKHLGHTLVFLHGKGEIEKALTLFSRNIPKGCVALPLYGSMSPEEQDEVLKFNDRDSERRMVVFCTNVAETSLTIQNVQLVIDSGLAKEARFDTKRRLTIIETTRISRSSAKQRKGRAGRTIAGHCVRLYNENDLIRDSIQPEILRSSLDLVILQIVRLGYHPSTFPFLDPPDSIVLISSLDLLNRLSCIVNETTLTTRGHLYAELALDPRLSALMTEMYIDIGDEHLLTLTATIVAILSAPGSLFFVGGTTKEAKNEARSRIAMGAHEYDSDLFYLCAIYNRWKQAGSIDRITNTCSTCHKFVPKRYDACRSCRVQHSNTNRLNNKILQIIDSSSESYVKTIKKPCWKFTPSANISTILNERDLIGEHLYKFFPEQLGHLLAPHLPDEGVRLMNSNMRARINNTSVFVQRLHDHGYQHFVSMSITQLPAGDYFVDTLHPIPSQCLPSVPTRIIFTASKIGWLVNFEMRRKFNEYRSESWCKWLVYEYNQIKCQLDVWGMESDELIVKPILNSMLEEVYLKVLNKTQSFSYGPIRASFKSGFLCTSIEKINQRLRLDLHHVPCITTDELHQWLRTKLNINWQDILENNFRARRRNDKSDNDLTYEAPPFYIVFKSSDAFQKAASLIPQYYVCPQNLISSSSTTGAYMGEKDAWGRQLIITTAPGLTPLKPEDVAEKLYPYVVDCQELGKKIRPSQPGIHLSNLPLNVSESFVCQALRPINPVTVKLQTPRTDGTGSSSALIFFADEQQRQQAWFILQGDLCRTSITITIRKKNGFLASKSVQPTINNLRKKPNPSQTFLVTTTNRDIALKLFKEILPNEEPRWRVDARSKVTVLQPDNYPDFNDIVQHICQQFGTNVQQQVVEQKHQDDRTAASGIRCIFNHASPPKTAAAAAMLAQITSPLVISISDYRQKCLFDELFEQELIQKWSNDLKLIVVEKKSKFNSTIEIIGPQIQKGQLMHQIADYSDRFDYRFRTFALNASISNLFQSEKAANSNLDRIAQKWANHDCRVTYIYKTKSIVIYGQPKTSLTNIDECEKEIKQMLSELTVHHEDYESSRQCSLCGRKSTCIKRLRLCGHTYCHCASSFSTQTFPLQCLEANCKTSIHISDLREIYDSEEFTQICKRSLQYYLMTNNCADDRVFCPNGNCDGLINKSDAYQTCIICGERVCAVCRIINDDLHDGRTCDQRVQIIDKMGEYFRRLFDAGEKYAREKWTPDLPPIIRIERNMHLVENCLSLERFYKGVIAVGNHPPPDLARGIFAFHGTDTKAILSICKDGFDPHRRNGQAFGVGEYFGVTAAISDGYCRSSIENGVKTMIVAFILNCHQVSTKTTFCHVVNNPIDWSFAYNLPVLVISYGHKASAPLILTNIMPSTVETVPSSDVQHSPPITLQRIVPATAVQNVSPSTTQNSQPSTTPKEKQSKSSCIVA